MAGCSPTGRSLDLLDAAPDVLREATVAGQPRAWVLEQAGLPWRLGDVVRAALPAGPPSRTVFAVDVPAGFHHATLIVRNVGGEDYQDAFDGGPVDMKLDLDNVQVTAGRTLRVKVEVTRGKIRMGKARLKRVE